MRLNHRDSRQAYVGYEAWPKRGTDQGAFFIRKRKDPFTQMVPVESMDLQRHNTASRNGETIQSLSSIGRYDEQAVRPDALDE
jgi:hypothetical protein